MSVYQMSCSIRGIAPLLQHKFGTATLASLQTASKKKSGSPDYSLEWLDTCYISEDGYVYQPAMHIEGALVRAASRYKIKGSGTKTWKDPFRAYVYVSPDEIIHHWNGDPILAPDESLMIDPTEALSISVMRVVVQRAAVARSRLMIATGWTLNFIAEIHDEQLTPAIFTEVLNEAGRAVGIGDFRPRYGRFQVDLCEKS